MSGIGNVYRAELLWRAGIDPHTPGSSIDAETLAALWDDAGDLLAVGLGAGWIVAHPDQVAEAKRLLARGEDVPRWAKRYAVYRRRGLPCPRCGTPVAVVEMPFGAAAVDVDKPDDLALVEARLGRVERRPVPQAG